MDYNFKEPTLEPRRILHRIIQGKETKEALAKYLQEKQMHGVIRDYVRKGYINGTLPMEVEQEIEEELVEEELLSMAEKAAAEVEYEHFVRVSRRLFEKNTSLALKFDAYTVQIRILLVLERENEISGLIKRIEGLIELGIDWGRKNKFKVYKGLYYMIEKRYERAAEQFLESLSTFEGEELVKYQELVKYTIYTGMISLSRAEIKKRIIESSDVCEVVKEMPGAYEVVLAFYECNYSEIFSWLCQFADIFADDIYLKDRADYFVYIVKVRAYRQLFMSYKAISLEQMSSIFRVRQEYMHKDIESMILRSDILCKINHQNMMIYNTPLKTKNTLENQAEEISHAIQKIIAIK